MSLEWKVYDSEGKYVGSCDDEVSASEWADELDGSYEKAEEDDANSR